MSEMSAPRRRTYHHGDLRRALVDAAKAIVAEQGAEAFTLREAARRVGVNHRAVYRHFADKDAVLAALAEEGFQTLVAEARAAIERERNGDARLLAMGRAYVAFAATHPAFFRVMFGPRLNEDGRFPSLEVPIGEAFTLLETEIAAAREERGTPARTLEERRDDAIALWAAMHGLALLLLMRRVRVKRPLLASYCDRVLGPTVRGLLSSVKS
jgi:AcrR family transcriptional regulator